jgi:SM-20-related protein
MPTAEFLRKFGLFVIKDFFEPEVCSQLRSDMRAGAQSAATVGSSESPDFVVDRKVRRVTESKIQVASAAMLKTRLLRLKPEVELHFQLDLGGCQDPQFLHYVASDFYLPHSDSIEGSRASPNHEISPHFHCDLSERDFRAA